MTFPDDYPAENLKGKQATFAVTVKAVKTAGETRIDEEFAKTLGLTDLDQLKKLIRDQQAQELDETAKRRLVLLNRMASWLVWLIIAILITTAIVRLFNVAYEGVLESYQQKF